MDPCSTAHPDDQAPLCYCELAAHVTTAAHPNGTHDGSAVTTTHSRQHFRRTVNTSAHGTWGDAMLTDTTNFYTTEIITNITGGRNRWDQLLTHSDAWGASVS